MENVALFVVSIATDGFLTFSGTVADALGG